MVDDSSFAGKRILIVSGIFPPDIGGPATYVPRMAAELTARGAEVCVITLVDDGRVATRYSYNVLRIPRARALPVRWILTIAAIIRHGWFCDLLYVNGLALESALANIIIRRPFCIKVVGDFAWERVQQATAWPVSLEPFERKRGHLKIELLKWLRRMWTRYAAVVIVPSRYLRSVVLLWGVSGRKVQVIYNAVEEPSVTVRQRPLSQKRIAITVARLVPWKGHKAIIDAVRQVPDMGLLVVGDGPLREELQNYVMMSGMKDRVMFTGNLRKQEVWNLAAGCDLFVLNSTYEGLPHVVLEMAMLGLPILATDVGGTSEATIVANRARLVDVGNAEQLLAGLKNMSETNHGESSRKTLPENFRYDTMVRLTAKTFESMIFERGRPTV